MFDQKRSMFEGFDHLQLTAPSCWLADRMRESAIVGDKSITVVPNGLDIDVFHPRESDALRVQLGLTDEYIVLSVGSNLLSEIKGGRWVLELAKRNPEMVFIMVGVEAPPASIPPNLKLIPCIYNQNLLAEYYSMADVLLLTSSKETFSMVSAESLACGTPVIGFDSGAPKEVAPPGFGKFVPYADLNGLESLLRKTKTGLLPMKTAEECQEFAVRRYAKDVMVTAYEGIYRQMTEKY
jgi:glycosyltransferase involved in cell wall biosynthesis